MILSHKLQFLVKKNLNIIVFFNKFLLFSYISIHSSSLKGGEYTCSLKLSLFELHFIIMYEN